MTRFSRAFILVPITACSLWAASGVVHNSLGDPISGASVTFAKESGAVQSAADGSFLLEGPTGVSRALNSDIRVTIRGGVLRFALPQSAMVSFRTLNTQGALLHKQSRRQVQSGEHSYAPAGVKSLPVGIYFIQYEIGDRSGALTLAVNHGSTSIGSFPSLSAARSAATAVDTIKISKQGYASKSLPLTSYSDDVGIVVLQNAPPPLPWKTGITYGTVTDSRDKQVYRTVRIQNQIWMAENLNYAGLGQSVGKCYSSSADSCAKYGRLYTWTEAMNGASSSLAIPSNVQGVCPTGWHVPSDGEWSQLLTSVGGESTAGTRLKSTSGWTLLSGGTSGNGTDSVGFRALPGGRSSTVAGWNGSMGRWWSATEDDALEAKFREMTSSGINVRSGNYSKTDEYSLRCVKDAITAADSTLSSLTVSSGRLSPSFAKGTLIYQDTVANSVSSITIAGATTDANSSLAYAIGNGSYSPSGVVSLKVDSVVKVSIKVTNSNGNSLVYTVNIYRQPASPWKSGVEYGGVTDSRDSKVYKTIKIGTQTWLAENLNFSGSNPVVGKCNKNSADSCAKYGRLYTWDEVMQGAVSSTKIPSGVRGLCPTGWHVPSDGEWAKLITAVGGESVAGKNLKATGGWDEQADGTSGNGTDSVGFRAVPSGRMGYDGTTYDGHGYMAYWWSATIMAGDPTAAWSQLVRRVDEVIRTNMATANGFPLRCVKD
jgi:uncharacterized protein (TIGR02145 family)